MREGQRSLQQEQERALAAEQKERDSSRDSLAKGSVVFELYRVLYIFKWGRCRLPICGMELG